MAGTYKPGSYEPTEDKRLTEVKNAENTEVSNSNTYWNNAITDAENKYEDAAGQYAIDPNDGKTTAVEKQIDAQNKQTEFAIQKIEQEKKQAEKDYIKQQSGAYVDWQKQSNPYGANAEAMAASGLTNTGYSESSQVSMYNTYQNRVTAARESFDRAVLNYNNSIQEAKLQNNSLLAEITLKALEQQLTLSLEGLKYKNELIEKKETAERAIRSQYQTRYQSVLDQIYREKTLAEQKRQHEASLALQREQFEWQKAQAAKSSSGSGGSSGGGRKSSWKTIASPRASTKVEKKVSNKTTKEDTSGYDYFNALIKSGANEDKVKNEIAIALRNGEITAAEAAKLRATFTPRGVRYN